ncbi:unnamed protein product [Effrenium voratum]|uniref:Amine oxidase n=1 Tax=Effrenium voratum TaxID=2562239 RepID=A0AA36JEC6_9DINO|nr:unnamed protein product [Effrenium voratum]
MRTALVLVAAALGTPRATGCKERVLVVGSGISGLVAAESLRHFGCQVTVLEALDRPGGRTHTFAAGPFAGTEEGAHWVHGGVDNTPVSLLLRMHNLSQVRVGGDDDYEGSRDRLTIFSEGKALSAEQRDGSFDLFQTALAAVSTCAEGQLSQKDVNVSVGDIWRRAVKVNYTAQSQLFLAWHRKVSFQQDEGASMDKLSAVNEYLEDYTDFYPEKSEGWEKHGDGYVKGGYSSLVARLAENLDIRVSSPATRIEYSGAGVAVTADGQRFEGSAVIVTASVGALQTGHLAFDPPLSSWKSAAIGRLGMGNVAKVLVKLSQPLKSSAYALGFLGRRLLSFCIRGAAEGRSRVLECFLGGREALNAEAMDAERLKGEVAKELADLGSVEEVAISKWASNPFIRGAWSFAPVNSSVQDFDLLAAPVGRVHFAGEGTCRLLYGNVHAAVVSGARAAHQVLQQFETAPFRTDEWPLFRKEILNLCTVSPARTRARTRARAPAGLKRAFEVGENRGHGAPFVV